MHLGRDGALGRRVAHHVDQDVVVELLRVRTGVSGSFNFFALSGCDIFFYLRYQYSKLRPNLPNIWEKPNNHLVFNRTSWIQIPKDQIFSNLTEYEYEYLRIWRSVSVLLNLFCFVRLRYFFYLHYQYSKLRTNLSNIWEKPNNYLLFIEQA